MVPGNGFIYLRGVIRPECLPAFIGLWLNEDLEAVKSLTDLFAR
jgi:hypothetical protein